MPLTVRNETSIVTCGYTYCCHRIRHVAFPFIPSALILLLQNQMMCVVVPVVMVDVELGIGAVEEAAEEAEEATVEAEEAAVEAAREVEEGAVALAAAETTTRLHGRRAASAGT